MENRIEKRIELKAPVSRVWKALTDHKQFGAWFRVELEGPFVVGQVTNGKITYPGYEHLKFQALTQKLEAERYFSFSWPHSHDPNADISTEPTTLVEFKLERTETGTLLIIIESGFENLPADRRVELFRGNDEGWTIQSKNIADYVSQNP